MAEITKPMFLHLSFFASHDQEAARFSERDFVSFEIKNETQFKAWLGQVVCNMYDLYKVAATEASEDQEVSMETMRMLSNPLYLELRSWIENQITFLNDDANRDGKTDFPWKSLIIHLGETYNEFVDHLEQHQIQFMPKVVLRKDPTAGRYDRRCEVEYGN
jgi:hypothetical protein